MTCVFGLVVVGGVGVAVDVDGGEGGRWVPVSHDVFVAEESV